MTTRHWGLGTPGLVTKVPGLHHRSLATLDEGLVVDRIGLVVRMRPNGSTVSTKEMRLKQEQNQKSTNPRA